MKKLLPAALLALALLAGCGKPEDKFVGQWDGKATVPQSAIDEAEKQLPGIGKMLEAQLKSLTFSLDLKKDGTYAFTTSAKGDSSTMTGKWTLSEDAKTVTLSEPQLSDADKKKAKDAGLTDQAINTSLGKALVCSVGEGGKTMTYTENKMGAATTLTFTKK